MINKIVAGQSVTLPFFSLRVGFFINKQELNKLDLFALTIPKDRHIESEIITVHNKGSSCGNIVLFGVPNHWLYEIDLRCLDSKYERIVLAVSVHADDLSYVELIANIEHIGTFALNTPLPESRILRVLEIYSYHGVYKVKAYGDLSSLASFPALYREQEFHENITRLITNIAQAKKGKSIKTRFAHQPSSKKNKIHYQISLIGAHSVGKSSIVAAMSDYLTKIMAITKLNLLATNTHIYTNILATALDGFVYGDRQLQHEDEIMLLNDEFYNYKVKLIDDCTGLDINLSFVEAGNDASGLLLNDKNIEIIRRSRVVIFPVDTIALIEQRGRWNESINKTRELTDLCKHAFISDSEPKLILLVPVKCETYLQRGIAYEVLYSLEKEYAAFLNFFRRLNWVACAVVPVQTFGHIVLRETIETEDGYPRFIFRHHHDIMTYSPRDIDQLWNYILSFLLVQTLRSNQFKVLLESSSSIQEALRILLSNRKQGAEGFKIIQGHQEMCLRS